MKGFALLLVGISIQTLAAGCSGTARTDSSGGTTTDAMVRETTAAVLAPAEAGDGGPAAPSDVPKPIPDAGLFAGADEALKLERRGRAADLGAFYRRLAGDIAAGEPIVATVYVALCDNDSQGIIPVKNRRICDGDDPARNMYWVGKGALAGVAKKQKWKSVHRAEGSGDPLMIEQVWKRRMNPGGALADGGVTEPFDLYIVGLAYRGSRIHDAFVDFLSAVHEDDGRALEVDGRTLRYGGAGHIVGYVGHDYMMDVEPGSKQLRGVLEATRGDSKLDKGVFALACAGDSWIRPFISRENVYLLALNVYLAFPNARTIEGILDGIAAGEDGGQVHRRAAKAFAKGQECGVGWARKALNHGPDRAE